MNEEGIMTKHEPIRIKGQNPDETPDEKEQPKKTQAKKAAPRKKRGRPTREVAKAKAEQAIDTKADAMKGAIAMGFGVANMVLSRVDGTMEEIPKEQRPMETFQFSTMEVESGIIAITDYIREVHPEWLNAAPAGMALLMWSLGCIGPRLLAGAQLYRLRREGAEA